MAPTISTHPKSAPAAEVRAQRSTRQLVEWLLLVALAALFLQRGLAPGWRTLNTNFPNNAAFVGAGELLETTARYG